MNAAPEVGTALEVQIVNLSNKPALMQVTLVRIDPEAPSTHRYVLRVDSDPRGKSGYMPGDEIRVEELWFIERSKLWPRDGGVRCMKGGAS